MCQGNEGNFKEILFLNSVATLFTVLLSFFRNVLEKPNVPSCIRTSCCTSRTIGVQFFRNSISAMKLWESYESNLTFRIAQLFVAWPIKGRKHYLRWDRKSIDLFGRQGSVGSEVTSLCQAGVELWGKWDTIIWLHQMVSFQFQFLQNCSFYVNKVYTVTVSENRETSGK